MVKQIEVSITLRNKQNQAILRPTCAEAAIFSAKLSERPLLSDLCSRLAAFPDGPQWPLAGKPVS